MAQVVAIKQRLNAADFPFSEIFIEHEGHRFYSRDFFVADTPANRAFLANAFLTRLKRFPSGVTAKEHKPTHGGYPQSYDTATSFSIPKRTFSIVKDGK